MRNMIGRQEVPSSASINFLMADRLRVAVHRHTSGQQQGPFMAAVTEASQVTLFFFLHFCVFP